MSHRISLSTDAINCGTTNCCQLNAPYLLRLLIGQDLRDSAIGEVDGEDRNDGPQGHAGEQEQAWGQEGQARGRGAALMTASINEGYEEGCGSVSWRGLTGTIAMMIHRGHTTDRNTLTNRPGGGTLGLEGCARY